MPSTSPSPQVPASDSRTALAQGHPEAPSQAALGTVDLKHHDRHARRSTPLGRWGALSRAEFLQFRRNKVIISMAVLLTLVVPLLFGQAIFSAEDQLIKSKAAAHSTEVFLAMAMLLVLYYSVLSMTTTRRDESVLKRLRTGEARDSEILTAISTPGSILVIGMFALVMVAMPLLGVELPVNPVALLCALVGAVVVGSLAALITSGFTKNAEAAQITSMPVLLIGMMSFASVRGIVHESLEPFLAYNPFGIIYDLIYLGMVGTTGKKLVSGGGALGTSDMYMETAKLAAILGVWIVILAWFTREYMRWETHR